MYWLWAVCEGTLRLNCGKQVERYDHISQGYLSRSKHPQMASFLILEFSSVQENRFPVSTVRTSCVLFQSKCLLAGPYNQMLSLLFTESNDENESKSSKL